MTMQFWGASMFMVPQVLSVNPGTTNESRSWPASTVYAGVSFNSNGMEYTNAINGGNVWDVVRGTWLTWGNSSDVWVQRVLSVGTLTGSDPGSGRLQLNTTRTFSVMDTTTVGGEVTATVTFNFYDAATDGNLLGSSGSIVLAANREADV
jgi:hypothetical protein